LVFGILLVAKPLRSPLLHHLYFASLGGDDFVAKLDKFGALCSRKKQLRHFNRALVVDNHVVNERSIEFVAGLASEISVHVVHHVSHSRRTAVILHYRAVRHHVRTWRNLGDLSRGFVYAKAVAYTKTDDKRGDCANNCCVFFA